MSHSVVFVILPDAEATPDNLAQAMAPFDENMECPERDEECHCKGWAIQSAANVSTNEKFGEWDAVRKEFHDVVLPSHPEILAELRDNPDSDASDKLWQNHIKDRLAFKEEQEILLADEIGFDPECEDCGGCGIRQTTSNEEAKWDWYTVGGRWTGFLATNGYDPSKDENNIEDCDLCQGTGDRPGWVIYEGPNGERLPAWSHTVDSKHKPLIADKDDPDKMDIITSLTDNSRYIFEDHSRKPFDFKQYERKFRDDWAETMNGCNGCKGEGKHVSFPGDWDNHESDASPVSQWLDLMNQDSANGNEGEHVPFAILTPDGEWHERARMGWWGMTSGDMPMDAWIAAVKAIAEMYAESHTVFVVDVHI
jgi:hypothetical protein